MLKNILMLVLSVNTIFMISISIYSLKKKEIVGAGAFSLLLIAMSIHSIGYIQEIYQTELGKMFFALRLEYLSIAFFPFIAFNFSRKFLEAIKRVHDYFLLFLLLHGFVIFILVFTSQYHDLYYKSVELNLKLGFELLELKKGNWYFYHMGVMITTIIYTMILIIKRMMQSSGFYFYRLMIVMLGMCMPLIALLFYFSSTTLSYLDLVPFAYIPMSAFIIYGLFVSNTLFFSPITNEKILDNIDESVIVLDKRNCIVRFNNATISLYPEFDLLKYGQSFDVIANKANIELDNISQTIKYNNRILNVKTIKMEQYKGLLLVSTDITKEYENRLALEEKATTDALTGLLNRRHFFESYNDDEITRNGVFALIDIDFFKLVNDTYGHIAGDELLITFSNHIRVYFEQYVSCRYGGEEFALYFEGEDIESVKVKIESFMEYIKEKQDNIKYTFSCGLATYYPYTKKDSIKIADEKLYEAKKNGRNRVCF